MSDPIDRQAAKDFEKQLHDMFDHIWDCEIDHPAFQDTVGELMEAVIQAHKNSAQPKRKPGKWIYGEDEYGIDGYHCDECGFFVPWDYAHKFINYIEDYNFCPHCGADMREDEDAAD